MEGAPLECKLVEIVNQQPLPPSSEALSKDSNADPVDVDGKKGQTVAYVSEQNKYIVETFEGDLVAIEEANLKEYTPPAAVEGGFDLAFPGSEERAAAFQDDILQVLTEKKYCVVQMSLKLSDRKMVARQVQDLDRWARFMPEFEEVYMGQRPDGKRTQWYSTAEGEMGEDVLMDAEPSGLQVADQQLSNLAICVCNVSPYLGFSGVCRSNSMLHMNCANSEEELNLLDDARGNAVGAGVIQGHLAFHKRRKVCMAYFVSGSGGTFTLHPPNRQSEDIVIPCQEGQAVIFRHDILDYTFLPEGRQVAMQAWVFREQQAGESAVAEPDIMAYADAIEAIPRGPAYGNNGKSIDNMSYGCRLPGLVNTCEAYWTGLCVGYDGVIRIPLTRWDHDFYFCPEPETAAATYRSYTQHEGMLDNDTQMMCFDNEFFGIDPADAIQIDPLARCCMEVGYDALYRAGWTKPKLVGESLVLVNGIANNEFESQQMQQFFQRITPSTRTNLNLSTTASRLHYCLGMQGRCSTIETACSSSLTAIALMHVHLRPDQAGQMKLGAGGKQEKYGMGMGANGHFDPFFMAGLCGAKMLSIQGRCFTFDQSGDGFLRSEGECAMYFKCSEGEDLSRLAMLCGSCMNQDGRSASLTAPHGPSQQECIRHSLREANIPALKIQMQELHGTGTALGDPIEVGALRATMMMQDGEVREHPLVKTSSKSNIGHTELNAGICGIIKCVLMGIYCSGCPNNHIRLLNPHIDSNAYPVYFLTEALDQGKNWGYLGVSSFGFGGSNARGDIWTRALCGPRNTDPGAPRCQLTRDRLFIWGEAIKQSYPRLKPSPNINNALTTLDDFDDGYLVGEQPGEDDTLYCIGSFNGWSTPEKMTFVEESCCYMFAMPLGEACIEQFQIVMNKNEYFKIFPASKFSGQDDFVLGPGIAPPGNHWVIDGKADKAKQGTIYHITLQWDMETRKKTISWEPSIDDYIVSLASAAPSPQSAGFQAPALCALLGPATPSPAPPATLPQATLAGLPAAPSSASAPRSPQKSSPNASACAYRATLDDSARELHLLCRRIDVDGNGYISELELISAVERDREVAQCILPDFDSSQPMSDERCFDEVDAVFNEAACGRPRIKFEEFVEYLNRRGQGPSQGAQNLRRIFSLMDRDQSGSVSKLELLESVRNHSKVAELILPHMNISSGHSQALGDEVVFDLVTSAFEAIAGGKRRFDWTDFERFCHEASSVEPRPRHAVDRPAVRVLVVGPGFGLQLNPRQGASIVQAGFQVRWCHDVPNPEQPNFPVLPHLDKLRVQIEGFKPHILAAASKGGAYVAGLWSTGYWRGPTLLINAHPTCARIPPGVRFILAHGSNDEVYQTPRSDLEALISQGEENSSFLYYTANSGQLPTGQLSRLGDRHNMESLLQYDLLPRLLDALVSPLGPEVHIVSTWRERLSEERLEAEGWLGYTPERLRRHWCSRNRRGRDAYTLFDVPMGSEEFLRVATIFRAAPREPPAYMLSAQAAWDRVRIVRLQRIENGLQVDGSTGPYHNSVRRSLEEQGVDFEAGVHSCWTFHGAEDSALESIVCNPVAGFQPLASGTRGASLWGLGTYFAREAKYVADGGFCGPAAADGSRRMLMCLLSSGLPCLGDPQHKGVLPFRKPPHRYHCSVDSLSSPEIYVAQHAGAAQPAYVITFA